MKAIKNLSVKRLTVNAIDPNEHLSYAEKSESRYSFGALEFENGLIMVEAGCQSNLVNWFFEHQNREEIDCCGSDMVESIDEEGEEFMSSKELLDHIQASIKMFEETSVPKKHFELWK